MRRMFSYYKDTVEKFFYGRQYLNREFFEIVRADTSRTVEYDTRLYR